MKMTALFTLLLLSLDSAGANSFKEYSDLGFALTFPDDWEYGTKGIGCAYAKIAGISMLFCSFKNKDENSHKAFVQKYLAEKQQSGKEPTPVPIEFLQSSQADSGFDANFASGKLIHYVFALRKGSNLYTGFMILDTSLNPAEEKRQQAVEILSSLVIKRK